jgi:transcriptional regulator with XRE-family HTH domain
MVIFMELKDQLIKIRLSNNMSKKDVSIGAGIPYTTYIKYEYGERELGLNALQKLADFYGMTTDDILGRTNTSRESAKSTDYDLKPLEQVLLKKYVQLSEDHRDAVLELITDAVHSIDKQQ